MFQLCLAELIQAEREREIAELIRQRRLLKPEPDVPATNGAQERSSDPAPARARAQTTGTG